MASSKLFLELEIISVTLATDMLLPRENAPAKAEGPIITDAAGLRPEGTPLLS
jgi:hypothetical protein